MTASEICGHTTNANVRDGRAPRVAAPCSSRLFTIDHRGPTMRSTTDTLKTTCAQMIGPTPRESVIARTPAATTTAGNTNGAVRMPRASRAPRNVNRESAHVAGRPITRVASVLNRACHKENHATPRNDWDERTSRNSEKLKKRRNVLATGTTKKILRNATGARRSVFVLLTR